MTNWMIYGATGYTGRMIAEAAVARGHRPLLAGRSAEKLKKLAQRLTLDYVVFRLDQRDQQLSLEQYDIDLVLNCAGPFVNTALPMQRACLAAGIHYLDITVETSVFEQTLSFDAEARTRGIVMMSGVGFNTIPTDCLAKYVSDLVPGATSMEIVLDFQLLRGELGFTSGTLKSIMGILPAGVRVRRNGSLVSFDLGAHGKVIRFPDGPRRVVPVPCGDVCTVYHATGIPNITAYIALPDWACYGLRIGGALAQFALRSALLRRGLRLPIERLVRGPSERRRRDVRALVGARASDGNGYSAAAWLETVEPYRFSVTAALLTVEQVRSGSTSDSRSDSPSGSPSGSPASSGSLVGALTPSMAFGADFVLGINGARRWDN